MKKIVSLMVFLALLIWTWNVIHSSDAIGFETHAAIQDKIADLIKQNLLAKKPESKNLEFTQLWTENIEGNKVRAHYTYRFQEKLASQDQTEQSIKGEAVLVRQNSEDPAVDTWKLLEVKTTSDEVMYNGGSTVSANENDSVESNPEASPIPSLTAVPAE